MSAAVVLVVAGGAVPYLRFVAPSEDDAIAPVPKTSVLYGSREEDDNLLQRFVIGIP